MLSLVDVICKRKPVKDKTTHKERNDLDKVGSPWCFRYRGTSVGVILVTGLIRDSSFLVAER